MAFVSNYGDLQTQFLALLNRRDCTTAQAQGFIQMAIVEIQRTLRVPAMEKSAILTVGTPWTGAPIPNDLLELINIIPISDPLDEKRLVKTDITRATQAAAIVGFPEIYARSSVGTWIIGPAPPEGMQLQVDYYAEFSTLSLPTDTNILITIAWDLAVYKALCFAGDFFTDKRKGSQVQMMPDGSQRIIDGWNGTYWRIFDSLMEMAEDDDDQGAAEVQPAYLIPDDLGFTGPVNWVP